MQIRCSSLPLIQICPASAKPPAVKIARQNKAADLGSAVHDDEVMAAVVDGVQVDLESVAARYEVPVGQLVGLFAAAKRIWGKLSYFFPDAKREQEIGLIQYGMELTGHIDVLSVTDEIVSVADWKSGRVDDDATFQLKGYALLALSRNPNRHKAYVVAIRLRDECTTGGRIYTRAELEAWWLKLQERVANEEYNPGESWCWKCPRFTECPAKQAILANAHTAMVKGVAGFPIDVAARQEAIGKLHDQMKLAKRFLDDLEEMIKAEVVFAGHLPIGHGRELWQREIDKSKIEFKPAEKVLREWLGGRFHEAISVGKTKAEDIVRDGVGKSQKKAAVQDFLAALGDAGAIHKYTETRIEVRRTDNQIEEK